MEGNIKHIIKTIFALLFTLLATPFFLASALLGKLIRGKSETLD